MREQQVNRKSQQRKSREEAERLVNAFERSGLRRREFCLKHGVALGTLDFWRKRRGLERERMVSAGSGTLNGEGRSKTPGGESRLVAVEVAGWPAWTESEAASGGLAVVLSRGRRIEVSRGFDAGTLARLLDVLERG
jgi:transposase-like protein